MKELFYPKSLVIIGASPSPKNLGKSILKNLERFSFKGKIFLVGKKRGNLEGRPIYPTIKELPETPDLAVFILPAKLIPELLIECGEKGIKWIVIESGGFEEYKDDKDSIGKQVLDIASKFKMRIVGPNCISIVNKENGLALPFMEIQPDYSEKGDISLISQSGGIMLWTMRLLTWERMNYNKMISIGNKLDLDEADYLEYLVTDPGTRIIGIYLESICRGRRLIEIAKGTKKPIIAIKANFTPSTHEIARFHTAALAGDEKILNSAFSEAGIIRVSSIQELINNFKAASLPEIKGNRLAIIGRSGGVSVISADFAHINGFHLPPFSTGLINKIKKHVRAGVIRLTNPLDLGDVFDLDFYVEAVKHILSKENVDAVVMHHGYNPFSEKEATLNLIQAISDLSYVYKKPIILSVMADRDDWLDIRSKTAFPLFLEPKDGIKALSNLLWRKNKISREKPSKVISTASPIIKKTSKLPQEPIELYNLLDQFGIKVAKTKRAKNLKEAIKFSQEIGFPVVLKGLSTFAHKTELGAVKTGITCEDELKKAYDELLHIVNEHDGFNGIIIQKMIEKGIETILSVKYDKEFGHVVIFGMGGILVELFEDVSIRLLPVSEKVAEEMISEIKGYPLLSGYRGGRKRDIVAVSKAISGLSNLIDAYPEIRELEINPLIVLEKDKGCFAVDVRFSVDNK